MSIELRFSRIDPPASEPAHSLYGDIVNLPDPVKLGLTVRIFNYDAVTLYMRVDGSGAGWTFTSNDLGAWLTGTDAYRNLDQFGSRARPASETTETITVRLRAYTDAGYTILKWTYERTIELVFIKSDDGTWTEDLLNNFDDGTVQGWAVVSETGNAGGYPQIAVNASYCLSVPYSVRMTSKAPSAPYQTRSRLYKTINTPNKSKVYAIADIQLRKAGTYHGTKNVRFQEAAVVRIFLGWVYEATYYDRLPINRWIRVILPVTPNTAVDFRIVHETRADGDFSELYLYMDDFRIISK